MGADEADVEAADTLLPEAPPPELSRHALAAWIIDETLRGCPLPHDATLPRTARTRAAYLFFENAAPLRHAAVLGLVLLSFFELPAWCSADRVCLSPDGSDLFLSGVPYLAPASQLALNAGLLSVLIFFVAYELLALRGAAMHSNQRALVVLLAVLVLDAVWVAAFSGYPPFRPAPYLRAALPLFYWTALRECTMSIVAVINPFVDIVVFVGLFLAVFGWVVTLLFHDAPPAQRYFGNLTRGLYSAFTSVTTADWPMQIMGALDVSRASALLFLVFIVIGVFFLFNVLLAVVYNAYTGSIEDLVVAKLARRNESLGRAFDVLVGADGAGGGNGEDDGDAGEEDGGEESGGESRYCGLEDIRLMFDELRRNKQALSDMDDEKVELIFTALDDNADDKLSRSEFLDIVDVLRMKFISQLEDVSPMEALFPAFHATSFWQNLAAYARSEALTYHVCVVMLINVAVVTYESSMDLRNKDTDASQHFFARVECGFSAIYILEMLLKVASFGPDRYWKDLGNRFDFAVTWLLLAGALYVLYPYADTNPELVRYLILLRCLRLWAVLADLPRFRKLVKVFSVLFPAAVPLFSFFFLSLYIFAAAGVAMFGGLIYANAPGLQVENNQFVDAYVGNDYWTLNFNDMASGWYVLFSAVIVSYLTEIAEAVAATSAWGLWTKWFFVAHFVVNSLIVANCVLAFVVDLFIMEDEQDDGPELELEERYGAKRIKVLRVKTTADEVYVSMFRDRVERIMSAEAS